MSFPYMETNPSAMAAHCLVEALVLTLSARGVLTQEMAKEVLTTAGLLLRERVTNPEESGDPRYDPGSTPKALEYLEEARLRLLASGSPARQ